MGQGAWAMVYEGKFAVKLYTGTVVAFCGTKWGTTIWILGLKDHSSL